MKRNYVYPDESSTHIIEVHTLDGMVRMYDESSRASELVGLGNIRVNSVPIGQPFRASASTIVVGLTVIVMTVIATMFASSLFLFKTASSPELDNADAAISVTDKCHVHFNVLERAKCYQGFVQHKLIERYEIPLNAERVKIKALPKAVCFKNGDRLLIVRDTLNL